MDATHEHGVSFTRVGIEPLLNQAEEDNIIEETNTSDLVDSIIDECRSDDNNNTFVEKEEDREKQQQQRLVFH